MRIVLLGAPGSGKATQATRLSQRFDATPIFLPQLLKNIATQDSELGLRLGELLRLGHTVPDELMILSVKEQLLSVDSGTHLLFVDFPRTVDQALALDRLMLELNSSIDLVLELVGDEDRFMERLEGREACSTCDATYNEFFNPPIVEGVCDRCGGRVRAFAGRNREAVANKMRAYTQQSAALLSFYQSSDRLQRVEGDGDIDRVFENICQLITGRIESSGGGGKSRPAKNKTKKTKSALMEKTKAEKSTRSPGKKKSAVKQPKAVSKPVSGKKAAKSHRPSAPPGSKPVSKRTVKQGKPAARKKAAKTKTTVQAPKRKKQSKKSPVSAAKQRAGSVARKPTRSAVTPRKKAAVKDKAEASVAATAAGARAVKSQKSPKAGAKKGRAVSSTPAGGKSTPRAKPAPSKKSSAVAGNKVRAKGARQLSTKKKVEKKKKIASSGPKPTAGEGMREKSTSRRKRRRS